MEEFQSLTYSKLRNEQLQIRTSRQTRMLVSEVAGIAVFVIGGVVRARQRLRYRLPFTSLAAQ
jgi:hypothetical protein